MKKSAKFQFVEIFTLFTKVRWTCSTNFSFLEWILIAFCTRQCPNMSFFLNLWCSKFLVSLCKSQMHVQYKFQLSKMNFICVLHPTMPKYEVSLKIFWVFGHLPYSSVKLPRGLFKLKVGHIIFTPLKLPSPFSVSSEICIEMGKKHNLILLWRFCLYTSSIDAVQLSPNHCLIVMMVSSRVAMVRFLLKLLLVKSGQQDGALLFCVARVKKKGGEFLGGGELIGRIRYTSCHF